jgi:hypothetical protein
VKDVARRAALARAGRLTQPIDRDVHATGAVVADVTDVQTRAVWTGSHGECFPVLDVRAGQMDLARDRA